MKMPITLLGCFIAVIVFGQTSPKKDKEPDSRSEIYDVDGDLVNILSSLYSDNLDDKPIFTAVVAVNLMSWISPPSYVTAKVPRGGKVKIISTFLGDWWAVYYEGKTGYVESKYLTAELDKEKKQPVEAGREKVPAAEKQVVAATKNAGLEKTGAKTFELTQETSLRTAPDSKAKVILRFKAGDRVEVIDAADQWWWEVWHKDKRGWVKKALLKEK